MSALAAYSASGVQLYSGTYTTDEANVSATGPIFKLPAGELQGAVGFDYIQDRYSLGGENNPNLLTSAGLIANAPFDNANATNGALKRTVRAEFGELDIPIIHGVDFDPSVRSDLYSGFGRTTNPKYTLRVAPTDWLLFRGSYSTGFRVPTFAQEYFPTTISPATAQLTDPVNGQTITSYNVWTGGKLTLQPETAKEDSVGVVLSPNKYLTFSADWWKIDRKNTIETLGVTTILQYYNLFPDRLIRDSNGNLTAIDNTWLNAGETDTEGIEYQAHGYTEVLNGRLSLDFDLGDLLVKKSRLVAGQPYGASEVGVFPHGVYGELGIKYKTTTTLAYTHGKWGVSFTQVYRDGYKNQPEGNVFAGTYLPPDWPANVSSYTLYHLMFTYRDFFIKGLTMHAGVKNLFNTHPPFVTYYDTNSGAGSDWDPRVGDPRDRSFVVSGEYKIF
jgi:iron complex outermembrane receptor protein